MIGGAVLAFVGFLVAWLIREVPLRGSRPPASGELVTEAMAEPAI
jgi:hypothetical protein